MPLDFFSTPAKTARMLNENLLLYGHEVLPPKPVSLRAGPLTLVFEPDNAFVRYIRLGDRELVRSIYAVVRDGNWNTTPWQVQNLRIDAREESFDITFDVKCDDGKVRYDWQGIISGTSEGQVRFEFKGEAKSDFLRNRIGICVLHPAQECAGESCVVEHPNGAREESSFPKQIAPWQPLREVRAITHSAGANARVEIRLEGDTFETEDQRNYGDASFKTYSTPQDLPKPVQVKVGDRVHQTVTVSLVDKAGQRFTPEVAPRSSVPRIYSTGDAVAKPALGVQLGRDRKPFNDTGRRRLAALRLSHVSSDVVLSDMDWQQQLSTAALDAQSLGLPLQLTVHLRADYNEGFDAFAAELTKVAQQVTLCVVRQQGRSVPAREAAEFFRQRFSGAGFQIAVAASPFFVEMNRDREAVPKGLLPAFPITPQVHLTDRSTLIENMADVTDLVETGSALFRGQCVITPVTLKRAELKATAPAGGPDALPGTVDPRQMSLFGAAWTLGHLTHLADVGHHVHSATYYEAVGWRGLMDAGEGSPNPVKFFSIPGGVFPMYHVFADLAEFADVIPTRSTLPLRAEGLTLSNGNRRAVLVASTVPETQTVAIETGTATARVRRLNARNAEEAMRTPEDYRRKPGVPVPAKDGFVELTLDPYEFVRLDLE